MMIKYTLSFVLTVVLAQSVFAQFVYLDPTSKNNYQRAQQIAREGTKLGLPHINTFRDNLMREKGVQNYYATHDGKAIMVRQLVAQETNRRERMAVEYVEAENKAAQIRAQQPKQPVAAPQAPIYKPVAQPMVKNEVSVEGGVTNVVKKYYDQDGNAIGVDENGNPILPQGAPAAAAAAQEFPAGFFAPPPASSGGGGGGFAVPQAAGPSPAALAEAAAAQEAQRKEAEEAAKQLRLKEATEDARNRRIETRDRLKQRIKDL